jgi:signal transduction histidine kinase
MRLEESPSQRWDLATESIVVKIRWFGVAMGYALVQTRTGLHNPSAVRAFLALGAGYAGLDTAYHAMGEVIFKSWPLAVSFLESVFIALLCYHDTGLASPFRWYYLLSLICCAIRFRPLTACLTFAMHCLSLAVLAGVLGADGGFDSGWPLTVILMAWVTWACSSLATLLKSAGTSLEAANADLARQSDELERRVAERTEALRVSQAKMIQHEKMAAFGLLAAGIAHEVGNPLAAVSSLVQLLRRRNPDPYTAEKLEQASTQVSRIHRTIRELIDYSRPASTAVASIPLRDVVEDALGIAKYYPRTSQRIIVNRVRGDGLRVRGVRDHVCQVILNLVLNSVDATESGGQIVIDAQSCDGMVSLAIEDDGRGISVPDRCRLFQPFFTTKPHGTGLGLFISRQVVEEMGGRLAYRTEPGQGSTFTVMLPLLPDAIRRPEVPLPSAIAETPAEACG